MVDSDIFLSWKEKFVALHRLPLRRGPGFREIVPKCFDTLIRVL